MSPRQLALYLLALPCLAQAAPPIAGDVTGMWLDTNHPGWGVGLVQQNDAVFATLFIYDVTGAPTWYVASRLEANGMNFDPCGTVPLTGELYRTAWPAFGSAANPQGNLQVQLVGLLEVSIPTVNSTACDRNRAQVKYFIDATQGTVTVTRLSWASNQARFYGAFAAGLVFSAPTAGCADQNSYPTLPAAVRQFTFNGAVDESNPGGVRLFWGTGTDTACEIRGTYSQGGQMGALAGTLRCGPIGAPNSPLGTIRLSSLRLSESGFVGELALDTGSCRYTGTISGARRPQ